MRNGVAPAPFPLFEPPYVWVVAMRTLRFTFEVGTFKPPYVWVVAMRFDDNGFGGEVFEPPYVWVVAMSKDAESFYERNLVLKFLRPAGSISARG
jgi:hypothetical protein